MVYHVSILLNVESVSTLTFSDVVYYFPRHNVSSPFLNCDEFDVLPFAPPGPLSS